MAEEEIDAHLTGMREARALEYSTFGASDYRDQHPDDWYQRASGYFDVCRDVVDCGKNEVMLGLLNGDEDRVASGRALMSYGAQLVRDVADDGNQLHLVSDLKAAALVADFPDAKASDYVAAFTAIREISDKLGAGDPDRNAYWARAVLSVEFSKRYHENVSTFADLDPGKLGGRVSDACSLGRGLQAPSGRPVAGRSGCSGNRRRRPSSGRSGAGCGFQRGAARPGLPFPRRST